MTKFKKSVSGCSPTVFKTGRTHSLTVKLMPLDVEAEAAELEKIKITIKPTKIQQLFFFILCSFLTSCIINQLFQ